MKGHRALFRRDHQDQCRYVDRPRDREVSGTCLPHGRQAPHRQEDLEPRLHVFGISRLGRPRTSNSANGDNFTDQPKFSSKYAIFQ